MFYKNEVGVCVDDTIAYVLEEKNDENIITIINVEESCGDKQPHEKKLRRTNYYKKIFEMIRDFEKVSLFGSPAAKQEIIKQLDNDQLSKLEVETDGDAQISQSEKIDFINRYFESRKAS